MKLYFTLLVLILFSCQTKLEEKTVNKSNSSIQEKKSNEIEKIDEDEKRFRDSLYNRESDSYISKLEEIPGRNTNAYKLSITQKNGGKQFFKILNTRPKASLINYCNDFYTVVGFSCGGPCYSQVFVFTDKNKPSVQFDYGQRVTGNPNIIAHIKDEEFEKLLVRNLNNGKELEIENIDIHPLYYGHMDTLFMIKNSLYLTYTLENEKQKKKIINLDKILN